MTYFYNAMSIAKIFILCIQFLSALGVIGLVLLQQGKGAEMGAAFGSGSAGSLFGVTGSANFLSRATAALATVFFFMHARASLSRRASCAECSGRAWRHETLAWRGNTRSGTGACAVRRFRRTGIMVRIALAQLNPTVGDFSANLDLIVEAAQDAYRQGARLLITPELAVSGYPPEDLLLRPAFHIAAERTLTQLAARLSAFDGFYAVIGHPYWPGSGIARASSPPTHPACYNAASVLHRGQVIGTYLKHFLPNTSVFDEQRYFARGAQPFIFNAAGIGYAVLICEDIWRLHAAQRAADAGAQILLALNSSPYHIGKEAQRMAMLRARTQKTGLPIVYVNSAGGQDELVFDGASCVLNAQGECVARMPKFGAGVALVDIDGAAPDFSIRGPIAPAIPIE